MSVGETLKRLRTLKQESQTEFAERLEISRTYLSDLENNRKSPSVDTLTKIADKLGITIASLTGEEVSLDDIAKYFEIDDTTPLNKNEILISYKDEHDYITHIRSYLNSIDSLFDLSLLENKYNSKRFENGMTIVHQIGTNYKGKPLTNEQITEVQKAIKDILD